MKTSGDDLSEAPIHPWGGSGAVEPAVKQNAWFTGASRRNKKNSQMGEGRLLATISKMAVVLLQSQLGFTSIVAEALERAGVQTLYTITTVDQIESMVREAQVCAKCVVLVCHEAQSGEVNEKIGLLNQLSEESRSSFVSVVCLKISDECSPSSPGAIVGGDDMLTYSMLLESHASVTSVSMPFSQREMIVALCSNQKPPEGIPDVRKDIGLWSLYLSSDSNRRHSFKRVLDRNGGGDSCSLDPLQVTEKLAILSFDCIVLEVPVIGGGERRRSWWKFAADVEVESDLPEDSGDNLNREEVSELLESIQQACKEENCNIIVLTTNDREHQGFLVDSGASHVLQYPCNEKTLLTTITNACNGNKQGGRKKGTTAVPKKKGTNKNSRVTKSGTLTVTSSDGDTVHRTTSSKKSQKYSEKRPKQITEVSRIEPIQRGTWDHGWVSLVATNSNVCGMMKGATHHVPQDRMCILENFYKPGHTFLGIFDGHGPIGHNVSTFLALELPSMLHLEIENTEDNIPLALKRVCPAVRDALEVSGINMASSGSTAVFAVLNETTMYIGNVGDSRAAIMTAVPGGCCRAETMTGAPLTDDHKPDSPSEQLRIQSCGGLCVQMGPIMRVVQPYAEADGSVRGLAMTRSFGDLWATSIGVVPDPDVFVYKFTPEDRYIVLASDGLWDVISELAVGQILHRAEKDGADLTKTCQGIVEQAVQTWADMGLPADDTSMVVAML